MKIQRIDDYTNHSNEYNILNGNGVAILEIWKFPNYFQIERKLHSVYNNNLFALWIPITGFGAR